jgi:hypothetical protein
MLCPIEVWAQRRALPTHGRRLLNYHLSTQTDSDTLDCLLNLSAQYYPCR